MDDLLERLRKPDIILPGTFHGAGGPFETYIDIKPLYGHPNRRFDIVKKMAKFIPKQPTCIVACGSGSILATAMAVRMYRALTVVHDEDDNLLPGHLTGYIPNDQNSVFIIDEVLHSGRTLRHAVTRVRETGATVVGCGVVVQRNEVDVGAPVSCLYRIEQLLE